MANKSDADSYNRIFVLGARDVTQDDVKDAFGKFGRILDIYLPKDKRTKENKGIVYVTYSKASEAALAIEEMNGQNDILNARVLKVVLASSKREGSVRDPDEQSKMLRLFIIVPSDYSERDIEDEFKQFGDVVSVNLLRDKKTADGQRLAYVKYSRAYDAAVALENCDRRFKPMFAELPKVRKETQLERRSDRQAYSQASAAHGGRVRGNSEPDLWAIDYSQHTRHNALDVLQRPMQADATARATLELLHSYPIQSSGGRTVLEALFSSKYVDYEQVFRLFDLVPGMETCNYDQSTGRATVRYSTPHAASYARDKMDTMEYPPGYHISVHFAEELPAGNARHSQQPVHSSLSSVQTLVESIQKATTLLQQAGIGVASGGTSGMFASSSSIMSSGRGQGQDRSDRYCSVPLPDRKPFAHRDSLVVERLFIVASPDIFDNDILEDCFCRFGDMIGAYFLPGKRFGYVKYASRESARRAMEVLHGKKICGNFLKVLPAEPMKRDMLATEPLKRGNDDFDSPTMLDEDDSYAPRGKQSRYV